MSSTAQFLGINTSEALPLPLCAHPRASNIPDMAMMLSFKALVDDCCYFMLAAAQPSFVSIASRIAAILLYYGNFYFYLRHNNDLPGIFYKNNLFKSTV
jgi:hypothetical protein